MSLTSEELLNPKFPHKFGRFIRRWKPDWEMRHFYFWRGGFYVYLSRPIIYKAFKSRRFVNPSNATK